MNQTAKTSLKLPIFLIVGPALIFIASFLLFAVAKTLETPSPDPNLFAEASPLSKMLNIVAMLSAIASFIASIPCLIAGIVLLAKRKNNKKQLYY